jgi:hypothetical protein
MGIDNQLRDNGKIGWTIINWTIINWTIINSWLTMDNGMNLI